MTISSTLSKKLEARAAKAVEEEFLCNVGDKGYPSDVWSFLREKGFTPLCEIDEIEPLDNYREWTADEFLEAMETMKALLYENMEYAVKEAALAK